jgi:5-methylcytosine-specific restriction enzyme A
MESHRFHRFHRFDERDQRMSTSRNRMSGSRWAKARVRQLSDYPCCFYCDLLGIITAATEVDHFVGLHLADPDGNGPDGQPLEHPHNYRSACGPCHYAKTRAEFGQSVKGCDADGRPRDPKLRERGW